MLQKSQGCWSINERHQKNALSLISAILLYSPTSIVLLAKQSSCFSKRASTQMYFSKYQTPSLDFEESINPTHQK